MQISVSIDSDQMRNGQPPPILGAIGHPRYNGISELTDFVITGLHCTIIICLLSHITIVETTDVGEREMNPVAITIINPQKEYWLSQESNLRPLSSALE